MKRATIEQAVKAQFGTMEPKDWQPTLLDFVLLTAGYKPETDEVKLANRHSTYMESDWYRRKFALVQNYLRIYGVLVLFLSCMLFTSCTPHLNPNGTVNRYHGLNGKETVQKQQKQYKQWKP